MKQVRYAVVGLGHIAQVAVLPAFANAKKNSQLTALVSSDVEKLKQLGKKYAVDRLYTYETFEECLASGEVDAVYIATPNSTHRALSDLAIAHGVHVLCEKPMEIDEASCRSLIERAEDENVKLMVGYRLHFDAANLKAVQIAQSGKLGELKSFDSVFTMRVKDPDNIRLQRRLGGGSLFDIGIYCINAARYLFRDEPVEVSAFSLRGSDPRFAEVDESTTAMLLFPENRVATFTTSFNAHPTGWYQLTGTRGCLFLDNAYEYDEEMTLEVQTERGRHLRQTYAKRDQFAPELLYFSECILKNKTPEPSGYEGLADVRVINALMESAQTGVPVKLARFYKDSRPSARQEIRRPPITAPRSIHASSPSGH